MACATADLRVPEYADLIGKPFDRGGRGPDKFDCYGLIEELGVRLGHPRLPDYQSPKTHAEFLRAISGKLDAPESPWVPCECAPGAIVTFRIKARIDGVVQSLVMHVGMVLPHDRFIHAWESAGGVCTERLSTWSHRVAGYYRFPS